MIRWYLPDWQRIQREVYDVVVLLIALFFLYFLPLYLIGRIDNGNGAGGDVEEGVDPGQGGYRGDWGDK